ncbi:MAG: hypothetical protein [Cressdnaviricota sp.]|nr:MAG: hypothetical protein [Cressdnaviricota sp.]
MQGLQPRLELNVDLGVVDSDILRISSSDVFQYLVPSDLSGGTSTLRGLRRLHGSLAVFPEVSFLFAIVSSLRMAAKAFLQMRPGQHPTDCGSCFGVGEVNISLDVWCQRFTNLSSEYNILCLQQLQSLELERRVVVDCKAPSARAHFEQWKLPWPKRALHSSRPLLLPGEPLCSGVEYATLIGSFH